MFNVDVPAVSIPTFLDVISPAFIVNVALSDNLTAYAELSITPPSIVKILVPATLAPRSVPSIEADFNVAFALDNSIPVLPEIAPEFKLQLFVFVSLTPVAVPVIFNVSASEALPILIVVVDEFTFEIPVYENMPSSPSSRPRT